MTSNPGEKPAEFFAEDFPALQDFLGAYFHEDFMDEYGSPESATKQFCEDAAPEEVRQTLQEWRALYAKLKGQPITEWQAALRKLGGAWQVSSVADVVRVGELLAKRAKA
jgi:CdiI immunity protein